MKNLRLWRRYLKPSVLAYGMAVLCVIISTVLLFLDRKLFSAILPAVFACGAYMCWFWLRRVKEWKLSGMQEKGLILFYGISMCLLGLLFLLSLLTNWV